jgi:hypothetical protein
VRHEPEQGSRQKTNANKMKKLIVLLTTMSLMIGIAKAQVPSYVPTNGLVGWWPFNGNANDESGNGNHGTVNGATLTNDRYGSVGKAYNFNGYDNYIRVPGQSALNMLGDYSVSLWFNGNYQNLFNNGWVFIAKRDDNGNCCSPYVPFEVFIPFNSINFAAPGVAYANGGYSFACVPNTSPIVYSQWQNLIVTNYLDTLSFYVDGQFIYSTYLSSTLRSGSTSDLLIGTINRELGAEWMNGVLDDIGLWNRALDSCEIKDLYFASLGNCCSAAFNTQPQSVNTSTGSNASFVAQSTSLNAIYQWQTNVGLGWQNLSNAGQYYGVTNDTLIVSNLTNINNQQLFRCVLTSGNCSDTSSQALLNVCDGFATQPSSVNAVVAQNASFTISSIASNPSYQWQSDLGLGWQNLSNAGQYSGVTNDTLFVSNLALSNNNQLFRCILTSGTCTDTSATATLSVTATNGVYQLQSESINIYPNPASNQINIVSNASRYPVGYKILNEVGQTILIGELKSNNTSLDISNLATGNYMLVVGTKHLSFVKNK